MVLILGLAVIGTTALVAVGSSMLTESREQATIERVEHAMTSFDSRSARVALGRSASQSISLGGTNDGRYSLRDDAGWIRIVHHNYTGAGGNTETIYNGTLGALVYENDETRVAYQGGGVWRRTANGSVMVSPPEFHYRGATLTLPLVLTRGSGHVSGSTTASVVPAAASSDIYPDRSVAYGAGTKTYRNPVEEGAVNVTVQSAYYEAWAEFFRTRTAGTVTVDPANQTVTLRLTAGGTQGAFEMPREGSSISVRGMSSTHAVENFTIVLAPDDTDAAEFDNLQWAMYVDGGRYEMEFHLRKSGEIDGVDRCRSNEFSLTVYFSDRNGDPYHGWKEDVAFTSECTDRDGDGVADETKLVANLTGNTSLTMIDLSSTDLTHFNPSGETRSSTITFDEHDATVGWEPKTFADSGDDNATINALTNHYLSRLGPNFDLTIDDKNSDTVSEEASRGTLEYLARGKVTYMHITTNPIQVRLTSDS